MTPRQIIEEVWTASASWIDLPGNKSVSIADTPIGPGVMINEDETDRVRARIAACAPEALKLLLAVEWEGDDGRDHDICCPVCRAWQCTGAKHEENCALAALLKKAGLR